MKDPLAKVMPVEQGVQPTAPSGDSVGPGFPRGPCSDAEHHGFPPAEMPLAWWRVSDTLWGVRAP